MASTTENTNRKGRLPLLHGDKKDHLEWSNWRFQCNVLLREQGVFTKVHGLIDADTDLAAEAKWASETFGADARKVCESVVFTEVEKSLRDEAMLQIDALGNDRTFSRAIRCLHSEYGGQTTASRMGVKQEL